MKNCLNVAMLVGATAVTTTSGFSVGDNSHLSRREAFQAAIGGMATVVAPTLIAGSMPAYAVVDEETPRITTRMGGLLVRFVSSFVDEKN